MNKTFLFIKIPANNQHSEEAMERMLHSLHRLLPQNTEISLELVSSSQFLKFYLVAPALYTSIIASQLYSQFPDAEIEETNDYFPETNTNMTIVQIDFDKSSATSFKTYQDLEENFLKSLSAVFSKADPTDKIFIQIAIKKVGSKIHERGLKGAGYSLFSGSSEKISKDLYVGKLRIAYVAESKSDSERKLKIILSLLKSLKGNNQLKRKWFSNYLVSKNIYELFKTRSTKDGDFWSAAEIATIYHFPYQGGFMSNTVQTTSKRAPAPDILPTKENVNTDDISFIGYTTYQNDKKTFGLKRIDRRRHLYIVGKTGSGKSKLLELLLQADIQSGMGCCLIDPHGDLALEIMKYVPKDRVQDVVYVDPADRNFPVGFNPLEPVEDYETRQHLSTFFIAIFKKLFAGNWSPRMEHLIRYITLALLETPDSNVLGISRILSDTAYRQRVIKQIQDPVVKAFWTNDFKPSDALYASEAIIPLMNKVGQFISNPMIRNIIGQKKNVLDFEKFMNEGKIVIINLSKGKLGEENTALLGSMFITKIQQGALARADIPEEKRKDFYFYVDEFQNFATEAFSTILSEARKYHLNLTIAHQYIAQLPDDVKATAFGNVGSIIVFGVGGGDAAYLAKEFAPVFTPDDMISLNIREMYIKMSIDGKITPPFSAYTLNISKPELDFTNEILNNSRMKYAQNRASVENEIARWTSSATLIDTKESDEFPKPII